MVPILVPRGAHYTMVNVSDQAAAVESLPPLPGIPHGPAVERPRLRITG
jgi:hypothetical protein